MKVLEFTRRGSRQLAGILTAGALGLLACVMPGHAQDAASGDATPTAMARAASKELGEALKKELIAAITNGGAISAISVCHTAAPAIAAGISDKRAMKVARTALKVRNPANAPDAFEMRILEDFSAKIAAGADPATLEHAETLTENGVATFRYMKAIPMAAQPCAACHGTDVKPDVLAEIKKLYPQDEATGFKPGELRGAFSIKQSLQ
jgi:hypothetical protein